LIFLKYAQYAPKQNRSQKPKIDEGIFWKMVTLSIIKRFKLNKKNRQHFGQKRVKNVYKM